MFNNTIHEGHNQENERARADVRSTRAYLRSGGDPERRGGPAAPIRGGNAESSGEEPQARGVLSYAHNRRKSTSTFYVGGGLMVASKEHEPKEQKGGGKRGKVSGFSVASRRRMLYMMAKTEKAKKPLMITLTYPDNFPGSPSVWKRDLKVFLQRLKYAYPGVGGVWKLEPQERGAPHYHLIVWLPSYQIGALCAWVSQAWFEVVGSQDEKHLLWHLGKLGHGNRPCVEPIRSARGVMAYAGKYVGKVADTSGLSDAWRNAGRWWGVFGVEFIPWAKEVIVNLTFGQVCKLMRLMRRHARVKARQYSTLTVFCEPGFWFVNLDRLL